MLGLIALVFVCFFLSDFNDLQINSSYPSWLFPLGGRLRFL